METKLCQTKRQIGAAWQLKQGWPSVETISPHPPDLPAALMPTSPVPGTSLLCVVNPHLRAPRTTWRLEERSASVHSAKITFAVPFVLTPTSAAPLYRLRVGRFLSLLLGLVDQDEWAATVRAAIACIFSKSLRNWVELKHLLNEPRHVWAVEPPHVLIA